MSLVSKWLTRDNLTYLIGAAGLLWETVVEEGERPTLVLVFGALLGLPVWAAVDRAAQQKRKAEADG